MNIGKYADLIRNGQATTEQVVGLAGRLIRGKQPEDFVSLTDDPTRKIVMLVDETGLSQFLGKTGFQMLVTVGYPVDDIVRYVNGGTKFKLVVFPTGGAAKLATWENVVALADEAYPQFNGIFSSVLAELKNNSFARFEDDVYRATGFRFMDVKKAGRDHPHYMTPYKMNAQLAMSVGTPKMKIAYFARSFLYFVLNLNELFSGDGYTYDANGNRGVAEYLIVNKPLVQLGDHRVIDVDVKLP